MNKLKQEIEKWEQETNPITEEIINEMYEHYENEEEEKEVTDKEEEEEVEIKTIPCSLDFGELKHLGYDY